jgi:hypothetical protein
MGETNKPEGTRSLGPPGSITISEYEVPDGEIEEKRSRVLMSREPIGPPHTSEILKFGMQIFLGTPGRGQIAIINPEIVNEWQSEAHKLLKGQNGNPWADFDLMRQIANVSIEREIHSCIVDQNTHPPMARGTCVHNQKIWHSNQYQLSFGTCTCSRSFEI